MKKTMMLVSALLVATTMAAQGVTPTETGDVVINVTTFGGMMALVTMAVTQLCKIVPFIGANKWAKILTSLAVGMASTMACWALQVSDYLTGLVWWQALVAGVAVGLSAAGFYDVIKALWNVFKPKE